jgi:ABC-type spermidine/putrescine transport system permease subunit II
MIRDYLLRGYVALVYVFLFIPPLYAVYLAFYPTPSPIILVPEEFTLEWYVAAVGDSLIREAVRTSLIVSVLSALSAVVLSVLGGRIYMKISARKQQSLLALFLMPALLPGIVVGLGLVIFFDLLPVGTGLVSLLVATLLWSLPFAVLVMLTAMANLNSSLRRASYDLGERRFATFRRVEYPIVFPGILGAFLFSFLFSFNEYIRSSFVGGRQFTIPMFLYSSIRTGGIPETLFATSAVLVVLTTGMLVLYVVYDRRA